MESYLNLLKHIVENGTDRSDRTGVGTRSVFGYQWRHDLGGGVPLLTTKKVHVKSVIHELLWFISGSTNIRPLQEKGVTIWNEWADANGDLGPVYGQQWRFWSDTRKALAPITDEVLDAPGTGFAPVSCGTIDQLAELIEGLKKNPDSRRHIVSAWNPSDVPQMKLPPCHTLWQCYVDRSIRPGSRIKISAKLEEWMQRYHDEHVAKSFAARWAGKECQAISCWREKGGEREGWVTVDVCCEIPLACCELVGPSRLSLHLYARSIDAFLGLPFNIASYAFLTHMLAEVTGMVPGELVISFGDLHIYQNHFGQVHDQLLRNPGALPKLRFARKVENIDDFRFEDFVIEGYEPQAAIPAPVAV